MVGLNKIMVIGNVGTEPEMRYTPNGNPVTTFRIASSRSYTAGNGERRQETEWFSVVAWNALAEQVSQYLTKGRRAYVEGRLKSTNFTGKDGVVRFRNEIIANKILFLDRQAPESGASEEAPGAPGAPGEVVGEGVEADDLPF